MDFNFHFLLICFEKGNKNGNLTSLICIGWKGSDKPHSFQKVNLLFLGKFLIFWKELWLFSSMGTSDLKVNPVSKY